MRKRNMMIQEFINVLNHSDRYQAKEFEDKITISFYNQALTIPIEKLAFLNDLHGYKSKNIQLYTESYYELMVDCDEFDRITGIFNCDDENVSISVTNASIEYIAFILTNPDLFKYFENQITAIIRKCINTGNDFIDLLKIKFLSLTTIRIRSATQTSISNFEKIMLSHCFQMTAGSYCYLHPIDYSEIQVLDRHHRELPYPINVVPELYINSKLGKYYFNANKAKNIEYSYLLYYQIIEYFYDEVIIDKIRKKINKVISHRHFRLNSDKDVRQIIKAVNGYTKADNNDGSMRIKRESDSLLYTLQEYIDIELLKDSLSQYTFDFMSYYSNHEVSFSNGNVIRFNSLSNNHIYNDIADRIYSNRNSIVHNKSQHNNKFLSDQHSDELSFEIPLIKTVAEHLITYTSKEI